MLRPTIRTSIVDNQEIWARSEPGKATQTLDIQLKVQVQKTKSLENIVKIWCQFGTDETSNYIVSFQIIE